MTPTPPLFDYCFTHDIIFQVNEKPINEHLGCKTFLGNVTRLIDLQNENKFLVQKILSKMDMIQKSLDEVGL